MQLQKRMVSAELRYSTSSTNILVHDILQSIPTIAALNGSERMIEKFLSDKSFLIIDMAMQAKNESIITNPIIP